MGRAAAAIAAAETGNRHGHAGEGAETIHQCAFTAPWIGRLDGDDAPRSQCRRHALGDVERQGRIEINYQQIGAGLGGKLTHPGSVGLNEP